MMAETITLRAYLNDLRGMVENESPTEVVSHCRYILQHYPQNVATYRLLGRALLQKGHNEALPEHFAQAADIFQRVLSVIPDDGIAHLALSEIREQEGAIDQAIWHIERAQEQMPGNAIIGEALRKLYARGAGQKSGGTDKLQLSQSALARQYANSQLYDEAVLELRRALHAEPERVDLQVLLGKLLWESQHRVEAGEVALEVLKRLPDCLEANALMAQLWLTYGRPSDAQPYLDRVEALDPYMAASILRPSGDTRDPNVLSRLDYTARAAAALSTETPEWVHELDALDDAAPFAPRGQTVDQIDTQAVFGAQDEPAAPAEWVQDLFAQEEDAAPDWYAAPTLAPEADTPSERAPAAWLDDLDEIPAESAPPQPSLSDLLGATPEWFGTSVEAERGEVSGEDVPDEPLPFALPGEDEPFSPLGESVVGHPDAALPDWFSGLGEAIGGEDTPVEAEAFGPLAWLDEDTKPDAVMPAPDEATDADWLAFGADVEQAGSGIEAQAQDAGEFGPDDDDIADLDRLFEALNAAEQGVTGTPSDAVESPEGLTADADEAFAAEPAPAPSDDWLAMFQESEPAEDLQPALGATETPPAEADVLPWDLLAEEASDADRAEAPPAYAREADAPPPEAGIQEEMGFDADWAAFDMLGESVPSGEVEDTESALEEIPLNADETEIPAGELFGEAAAPADEDLLAALSQATADDDDDWLRQFGAEAEQVTSPIGDVAPGAIPADEDWLREIQAETEVTPPAQDEISAPEPPRPDEDWLRQLESEAEQVAAPQDQPAPETLSDDDIMAIFGEPVEPALPEAPATEGAFDFGALSPEDTGAEFAEFAGPEAEVEAPGGQQLASEPEPLGPVAEPAPDDWLSTLSDEESVGQDDFAAFAAEDEGAPGDAGADDRPSLFGLARAIEQAQQEDVPDWMAGLEAAGSVGEDEVLGGSVEDVYDPFESGDASAVPTYESAGHTGVLQPDEEPDWMGVFEDEADIEGEGAAEDADAIPDFSAANLVDEPDDALDVFDAAVPPTEETLREPVATETFGAIEWDMPGDDLILGVEPEPRVEADADIPDWLSAITQTATQDDSEVLPEVDDMFAAGDAEVVPDWLREIEEPAADDEQAADSGAPDFEALAPAGDLADTRDALPAVTEGEDDFDDTFSFTDRVPTWLRRASQRPDDGFENA